MSLPSGWCPSLLKISETGDNTEVGAFDQSMIKLSYFVALCELFDKTDTGGDGTISLKEYMAMCDEYGIELTDEHIQDVKSISNDNGEVKKHCNFNFNSVL